MRRTHPIRNGVLLKAHEPVLPFSRHIAGRIVPLDKCLRPSVTDTRESLPACSHLDFVPEIITHSREMHEATGVIPRSDHLEASLLGKHATMIAFPHACTPTWPAGSGQEVGVTHHHAPHAASQDIRTSAVPLGARVAVTATYGYVAKLKND